MVIKKKNNSKSYINNNGVFHFNIYNKIVKYYDNNKDLIKFVLSFILSIGLVVILYSVYSYYKNLNIHKEGFIEQEPYDLLDKINTNIYALESVWDNQTYNQQPGINESPISFWKITKQDSNYKIIGHAVNNIVNPLKLDEPIAPKDKTMLIDGDTKVPDSVKLIYNFTDNQITTKRINDKDEKVFKNEYINIKTLEDVENRLNKLEILYKNINASKEELKTQLNNEIQQQIKNIDIKAYIYGFGNYFANPLYALNIPFGKRIISSIGEFNCVRIPLGCNVKFIFSNKYQIVFDQDFNALLTNDKKEFKKISYDNAFKEKNGKYFKYKDEFNIFNKNYGLNKGNTTLSTSNKTKVGSLKQKTFHYPYNYSVSDHTYNGTGMLKNGLTSYIDNITDTTNNNRQKYIDGYDSNTSEVTEFVKLPYSNTSFSQNIYFIPGNPLRAGNIFEYREYSVDRTIKMNGGKKKKVVITDPTPQTKTSTSFKNIEGFITKKNLYKVPNYRIHVENDGINFIIDVQKIISKIDSELNKIIDLDWMQDIKNFILKNITTDLTQNTLYSTLFNNTYNNNSGITFDNNVINIKYPLFYLDFVFNYPVNKGSWDRRNNCGGVDRAFVKCSQLGNNDMAYIKNYNMGHKSASNIKELQAKEKKGEFIPVYLNQLEINTNYSITDHPVYKNLNDILNLNVNLIDNLLNKIAEITNSLNELKTIIISNQLNHLPMKIYRPIPPKNYKSVGDLIFAQKSNFSYIDINYEENDPKLTDYACIPEQCVREVREWLPVDKIYEYQKDNKYLAIFKNPYLQTFRAVTTPGTLPPGKVEKVIACVESCKLVDDIIQADKCAKTFYKTNKNITDTFNMDPDNIINERKNSIYKNKIANRQDRINLLKETARRLQVQDDKANIINKSYNRNKLQDLVDKQRINMHKLVDNLDKGKNKIAINVRFNYEKLFELCNNNKLPSEICKFVKDNIKSPSSVLTDEQRSQYDQKALQAILDACPTPNMENYVKRSLVENNCGCYFTDQELEIA